MQKIIIVCEKKYRKYGDFLAQLVSANDDTEDEIVGVKDGSVQAQVWTKKDYNDNAAQIASNQNILFIGNDKFVKEKSSTMPMVFSEYGMTYNNLGKQATLMVNKSVSEEMYNDFIAYVSKYQRGLEMVIYDKDKVNALEWEIIEDILIKSIVCHSLVGAPIFVKSKRMKKIEDQQFMCAVMKFYLEYLSDFMGR